MDHIHGTKARLNSNMTSVYQEFIKQHAKQSALRMVKGGGGGTEDTAGSSQGAFKGLGIRTNFGSSKKSMKNRSKVSMTRSKRTVSERGFGFGGPMQKTGEGKVVLSRNINQSSSTRLVIDDNLGSDANLTTNHQMQEEQGQPSEPDENDAPDEPQLPTFAMSFKDRKKSKGKGKPGKMSPKALAGK